MSHFATVLYVCRKEERSKQGQTNNKVKQHNTPKAVTFPKKNELPRVGLEPTTLNTLDRALYQLSYQGSSCTPIVAAAGEHNHVMFVTFIAVHTMYVTTMPITQLTGTCTGTTSVLIVVVVEVQHVNVHVHVHAC